MTFGFCYEIQIMKSQYLLDTVPVDFKLDNSTLRGQ